MTTTSPDDFPLENALDGSGHVGFGHVRLFGFVMRHAMRRNRIKAVDPCLAQQGGCLLVDFDQTGKG